MGPADLSYSMALTVRSHYPGWTEKEAGSEMFQRASSTEGLSWLASFKASSHYTYVIALPTQHAAALLYITGRNHLKTLLFLT